MVRVQSTDFFFIISSVAYEEKNWFFLVDWLEERGKKLDKSETLEARTREVKDAPLPPSLPLPSSSPQQGGVGV